jgi:hypothetical protein
MTGTIHIMFGEAGATELREALWKLGRDDRVLDQPDDLAFGPIAPADPVIRANWVANTLGDPKWRDIVPHVERFWAALHGDERHVVWFSRRVTRDYAGFLEYLSRIGDRPCDVVDLTEIIVPVRGVDSAIVGSRRAITVGLLEAYQFLDANLFAQAVPLTDETRGRYRAEWDELRNENAPLRVVTSDLRLMSAPISHFDAVLLKQIEPRFLKAARIVGTAMMEQWDQDIINVGDFFLSCRLSILARAGVIESKGDLRRLAFSEVRSPQLPSCG